MQLKFYVCQGQRSLYGTEGTRPPNIWTGRETLSRFYGILFHQHTYFTVILTKKLQFFVGGLVYFVHSSAFGALRPQRRSAP